MSAPASAARVPLAMRVVLGRKTNPALSPVATQALVQNGRVKIKIGESLTLRKADAQRYRRA
jgi:hypothetical protein